MKNNIKKELMEFPRKRMAWKGGVYWKDVLHEIYISHPHGYGIGKGGRPSFSRKTKNLGT